MADTVEYERDKILNKNCRLPYDNTDFQMVA